MKNREHHNYYVHNLPGKYYRKLYCVPASWVQVTITGDIKVKTVGLGVHDESPECKMIKLLDEECEDLYTFMHYFENNLHHIVLAFKDHDDALKLKLGDLGNKLLDCLH